MIEQQREFNPRDYLIAVSGKEYLEVAWRIVWLREQHPDAIVTQELVDHDKQSGWALFKTSVNLPGGGYAEGYGSESKGDFHDYLEKAATKSLGRALATLGFGTAFSAFEFGGEAERGRVVDAPQSFVRPAQTQSNQTNQTQSGQPPRQDGFRGVQNPDADITPGQLAWVKDLLTKNGLNPDHFDLQGMKRGEASRWIDSLKSGGGIPQDAVTSPN
jgi:hypothetical protein